MATCNEICCKTRFVSSYDGHVDRASILQKEKLVQFFTNPTMLTCADTQILTPSLGGRPRKVRAETECARSKGALPKICAGRKGVLTKISLEKGGYMSMPIDSELDAPNDNNTCEVGKRLMCPVSLHTRGVMSQCWGTRSGTHPYMEVTNACGVGKGSK